MCFTRGGTHAGFGFALLLFVANWTAVITHRIGFDTFATWVSALGIFVGLFNALRTSYLKCIASLDYLVLPKVTLMFATSLNS